MTTFLQDPNAVKPKAPGGVLDPNGPIMSDGGAPPPTDPTQFTLGNGGAPFGGGPQEFDPSSPKQAQEDPGLQAQPSAPALGGSADFPSLPPGATPPPGFFDPITGKTAPAAPVPGAPPMAAPPTAGPAPTNPGMPAPTAPPPPVAGAPGAPGTPPTSGPPPVGTPSPTGKPDRPFIDNEILRKLLEGDDSIDMNNPAITGQMDAFAANRERSRRNSVDSDAERLAGQGMGSSGEMDVERRMENEDAAHDTASFAGDLAYKELTNQRAEYQKALDDAIRLGLADQEAVLREKIANIDATVRNRQIDVQEDLGKAELQLREFLGKSGLDLQKLLGMGDLDLRRALGMAGINLETFKALMQNEQFLKDLGFRIGSKEADLNKDATRQLLEG